MHRIILFLLLIALAAAVTAAWCWILCCGVWRLLAAF